MKFIYDFVYVHYIVHYVNQFKSEVSHRLPYHGTETI